MAITKIQTGGIPALAVTHDKLHTTMDLSGKTVTLPTLTALDVTNNIVVGGTVDGIDIAARDAVLTSTATTASAALPLAGGTMTGALNIESGDNLQIKDRGSVLLYNTNDDNYARIRNTDASGNELQFSTNALAMTIDINGNVGIGTTATPTATLEVSGGTGMTGGWGRSMVLRHNFPVLVFQSEYNTDAYAGIGYDNSSGMKFWVNSPTIDPIANSQTPALTLLDNKNVGIGTTNPTAKLHVQTTHSSTDVTAANTNSTLTIGNTAAGNGIYNAIKFAANQQDMYIMSFNNTQVASRRIGFFLGSVAGDAVADERLSILGSGLIGIGTSSPSQKLHVEGAGNQFILLKNSTTNDGFYFKAGTGASSIQSAGGSNVINFFTSGTERMRIDSSGRVTKPANPSFAAHYNGSSWTPTNLGVMVHNSTGGSGHNIGGHYNTSTGRFTAPVAGVYHFDWYSIITGNYNNAYVRFSVNSARIFGGDIHITKSTTSASGWDTYNWNRSLYMAINDYIEPSTHGNITYHGNHWNCFSGHLVG